MQSCGKLNFMSVLRDVIAKHPAKVVCKKCDTLIYKP
jgi:hypothetical protein